MTTHELTTTTTGLSARDGMLAQLLDPRRETRVAALRAARTSRSFDPYSEITVRALLFAHPVEERHRIALGRHLTAVTRSSLLPLGSVDGMLLVASSASRCEGELDDLIRAEAGRRRLRVAGVGSAEAGFDADDLMPAAAEARGAAELQAALGQAATVPAEHMGTWMLLHAVHGSRRLIERASPAAVELWQASDPLQRITIEAYLDAGGQVAVACKRLHVHRTTLYYRLENMPPVVREALADGLKRSTLHLALKLLRLRDDSSVHPSTEAATG